MTTLNLTDCCLLEASGELTGGARERLHIHLATHPKAQQQFVEIERNLNLLRALPPVEFSPLENRTFADGIKDGIQKRLHEQTRAKRAATRWKFVSYALSGLGAAAAVVVIGGVIMVDHSAVQRHEQEKTAGIERATERLALYGDQSTPYDVAINNVQASVNKLQAEGPTLVAGLDNTEMSNVLNALTTPQFDDTEMETP